MYKAWFTLDKNKNKKIQAVNSQNPHICYIQASEYICSVFLKTTVYPNLYYCMGECHWGPGQTDLVPIRKLYQYKLYACGGDCAKRKAVYIFLQSRGVFAGFAAFKRFKRRGMEDQILQALKIFLLKQRGINHQE